MFIRGLAALAALAMGISVGAAADLVRPERAGTPAFGLPSFYLHVGVAGIINDPHARIRLAGVPLSGANVEIEDRLTFAAELGYFFAPGFAVSLSGGVPPISKIEAAGSLRGAGTLAKTQGGPAAATIHYHVAGLGAFQPYIGAGIAALLIFKDEDRLIQRYETRTAFGPVLQAGFDYMLDARWGVFFDVKKAFLTARTKGYLAGLPVRSNVSLDPVVLHSGLTYRF